MGENRKGGGKSDRPGGTVLKWDLKHIEELHKAGKIRGYTLLNDVVKKIKEGRTRAGKREDLDFVYYRSAWESNYQRYLNWLQEKGEIDKSEYEPHTFEFPVKKGSRFYTPDFRVWKGETYKWHEVKGWMDAKSATKIKRFRKYYPNEELIIIDSHWFKTNTKWLKPLIPFWESEN